jgi:hypothetical protein
MQTSIHIFGEIKGKVNRKTTKESYEINQQRRKRYILQDTVYDFKYSPIALYIYNADCILHKNERGLEQNCGLIVIHVTDQINNPSSVGLRGFLKL